MLRKPITALYICVALLAACEEPAPVVSSTIITNAVIHNGSGSEAFHGAVRIDGGRIIEIGEFEALVGETVFDAGGLVLAPGFIVTNDNHGNRGEMPSVLSQGITTIVDGLDGSPDTEDLHLLPLEEAIYMLTGLPAASHGIENRGRIRTGYFADLVLFDPDTIEDTAAMQDSTTLSVRINKVWIDGVLVFENGRAVSPEEQ